ncbi:hypothetical protein BBC27_08050 [Acidithiobacillus ferrivorans]|uniref:Uncharacterized protein n=1 Tax=Acidithiobacillus ferrivorans TaxID=160808 RepID=A0A1B9C0C7_9PROT|nr:hypothetical protein [Acidithiobacillus ferrivorans]OCB03408.1 hypothetical protein BBC27_08050 [Acidithiobacillus ferrivorans]
MTESETTEMSRTQLWKRARDIMKTHEIMDGSGHLYLKNRGEKVSEEQTRDVIAFVHAELEQQGISEEKAQTVDSLISQTLRDITRRGPVVPRPPKPLKQKKPAKSKPQLTVKKANPRTETRQIVIQVTVKKARFFHYPLDLPSGDVS